MIMCYSGFSGFGGDRVEPRVGRFVFLKVPKAFRDSSQIELRHLCPNKDYMTIRDICIYIYKNTRQNISDLWIHLPSDRQTCTGLHQLSLVGWKGKHRSSLS